MLSNCLPHGHHRCPPARQHLLLYTFLGLVATCVAFPRPRPRLYSRPIVPEHLIEAERALLELAPGSYAAAGRLADGTADEHSGSWTRELPGAVEDGAILAALAGDDDDEEKGNQFPEWNRKKYEEYVLRGTNSPQAIEEIHTSYTVELSVDETGGLVPAGEDVTKQFGVVTADGGDEGSSQLAVRSEAQGPLFDTGTEDMFAALKREADAYTNPQTGKPVRWGDTWMHSRGGGIGTGRPESRPRRFTEDGTTEIMPAEGHKGYALVPTSVDKRALQDFYDECNGIRWGVQRNWGVGEPCAQAWHGIHCVGGRVTEIHLNLNNVACMGKLNFTALMQLNELLYLDLSDNYMSGTIPKELFAMTSLQSIVLSGNRIEGKLPADFSKLVNLRHLDLSANRMHGGIPKQLGHLAHLEVLYLGEAGVETRNNFKGPIPGTFSEMRTLRKLSLAGNSKFGSTLPEWLFALPLLEEVTLAGTGIKGAIPEDLSGERLTIVNLAGNKLKGTLPEALGALTGLVELRLEDNEIEGPIPEALAALPNIQVLNLENNELTGSIPPELGQLGTLSVLSVGNNHLTGGLPPQLANITHLKILDASHNNLDGELPAEVLGHGELANLHLPGNKLVGSIPGAALHRMGALSKLTLSGNILTGSIPSEIGNVTRLETLNLAGNALEGALPTELGLLAHLMHLDVHSNLLEGPLPLELANLPVLSDMLLSRNRFTGQIPEEFGQLSMLGRMSLDANMLSGSVPAFLTSIRHLSFVDLSNNRLTGELPASLWDEKRGRVPYMAPSHHNVSEAPRHINLGLNPFTCPIPAWASEVHATCQWAEVFSIEPYEGPAAEYTDLLVFGAGFPSGDGLQCILGAKAEEFVVVPAVWLSANEAQCVMPPLPDAVAKDVVVRIGMDGKPITQFGEVFTYL